MEALIGILCLIYFFGGVIYFFILLDRDEVRGLIFIPLWPLVYVRAAWKFLNE